MRKFIYLTLLAAFLCLVSIAADAPLLPDHFGAWHASSPSRILPMQELGNSWGPGTTGGRILKETGTRRIEERDYEDAGNRLTLRAYQLPDPSSAFELYTYLLAPGMHDIGIGENSAGDDKSDRFLVGNVVVEATFSSSVKPEALQGALAALQGKADRTPLPPLKAYLPTHSRVNGSQKYALGPEAFHAAINSLDQAVYADLARVVGFESGAEAMLARFESGHQSGVLLLIEYQTPQLAEQHLHHLQVALPAAAKQTGVK